jgi:glycine cleavage system H protein
LSDIFSPVTGSIETTNEVVLSNPGVINEAPYETWLVRVKGTPDPAGLMSAAEYKALIEE